MDAFVWPADLADEVQKPYPQEHAARMRDPKGFIEGSFRSKGIASGVRLIMGKETKDGPMTVQAYRFDKDEFTPEQAKKWLKDHEAGTPIDFEEATAKYSEDQPRDEAGRFGEGGGGSDGGGSASGEGGGSAEPLKQVSPEVMQSETGTVLRRSRAMEGDAALERHVDGLRRQAAAATPKKGYTKAMLFRTAASISDFARYSQIDATDLRGLVERGSVTGADARVVSARADAAERTSREIESIAQSVRARFMGGGKTRKGWAADMAEEE